MRKFINKFLIFLSPFALVLIILILVDAYKVFRNYFDYYENSFIELNREMVCTRTYMNYRETENFNSFIFGSSRSQAFKCVEWEKYLDKDAKSFHFDAHGEGIYGIANKVEYIDKLGENLNNVLVILDRTILSVKENRTKSHLYISPPTLSNESPFQFYYKFIEGQINYKFLFSYFDYSIFKTYRDYMEGVILNDNFPNRNNPINCEIWYGKDQEIKEDSLGYYDKLKEDGIFYNRPLKNYDKCEIDTKEVLQLKSIKRIFDLHKTDYKIIISPNYDQIPLEEEQVNLLNDIFGKENIYNFSGRNKFTEPVGNYYEDSHFRPNVADEILKIIYDKNQ